MAKYPTKIHQSGFEFLNALKNNNNRDWFNEHKTAYQQEKVLVEDFAEALLEDLRTHDLIETPSGKRALYRIYRDVRFSHDKTPYQTYWGGAFKRATKFRRGGYYFHLEQGKSFVAGAFWGPSSQDLKLIRNDISFDDAPLRKILNSESFISNFGTLKGEQLKTSPKGFDADHEAIDLLRYKQFLLIRSFSDEEVLHERFLKEAGSTFREMRPFFDYMSEVLTSDGNGGAED
ncbi:DUF2461 domain-containing protein [Pedobacter steynii]|uniref:TIGR02453 family protein n=1 Tax=Pedobacter steynii TaxID=430522 RepID=A0A1D7QJ87_9SPHI|nr:DUF2461 domain-containing protein [Pedobacter steynii]AOM78735.1 TIGR02453 family protein [Pedobacter steynii]